MKQKRPPTLKGPSKLPKPRSIPVDEKKDEPAPTKEPWFGNDPQTLSRDFTTTIVQVMDKIVIWAVRYRVPVLEAIDWLYSVRQEILLADKIQYEKGLLADVGRVKNRPAIGVLSWEDSYDCLRNHLTLVVGRELESCYEDLSSARRKNGDFQMRYPHADVSALVDMTNLRPAPKWPEDRP